MTKRAKMILTRIVNFDRGCYRRGEQLSVSPRMWNILIAAGMVEEKREHRHFIIANDNGRFHQPTEAAYELV